MPMYEVRAIVSYEYVETYHVEADSDEEARCMVEEGDASADRIDRNILDEFEVQCIDSCELLEEETADEDE